jgi:hypothetical protein
VYFDLDDISNTTGAWDLYGSDAPSPYNGLQVPSSSLSFYSYHHEFISSCTVRPFINGCFSPTEEAISPASDADLYAANAWIVGIVEKHRAVRRVRSIVFVSG